MQERDRRTDAVRARPERGGDERGVVLLIAIAILALLSLFATAFVRLVNFERRASVNYTDGVRARLLAKAGLEEAIARLRDIADDAHYVIPGGRWQYRLTAPDDDLAQLTALDLELNLLTTTTPSFALDYSKQLAGGPRGEFSYLGAPLAVSGVLAQTYSDGLDVYKLKVLDAASQLNLNHPDPDSAKRMLASLLIDAAELDGSWGLNRSTAEKIAAHVIDGRPSVGFQSKAEIQQLLVGTIPGVSRAMAVTEARWNTAGDGGSRPAIRDMVTVYSWTDESVIRPWNLNGEGQRGLTLMPRAPVGLNSAPRPVLVAMLANIKAENNYGTFHLGFTEARALADAIIARRNSGSGSGTSTDPDSGPFRSWPEFETWLDEDYTFGSVQEGSAVSADVTWWDAKSIDEDPQGLVPHPVFFRDVSPVWGALQRNQGVRDLIKAQLNPNTMLTKFGIGANHGGSRGPVGAAIPRLVDKSDLTQMTTEACFDSGGVFEVTSLGMLVERDAEKALVDEPNEVSVVAAHTVQAVVRIYDVIRLTTQADFERHRALMLDGDFIPDTHGWRNLAGYNRNEFLDHPGWPGMITHPVYSLARKSGEQHHAIRDEYAPAVYDGHVTLSNLLGVSVEKHDFVAGFARGSLEAFKARAWWDPKDIYPNPAEGESKPLHPGAPSHPAKATPKRDLQGRMIGATNTPLASQSLDAWYDSGAAWPLGPDWGELERLVNAKGQTPPATAGVVSAVPDPLDSSPTAGPLENGVPFWYDGSALWNNGVAVDRFRSRDEDGNPAAIAFDSDNLNLTTGCSIRFWVQPTVDPYLHAEEVLFSFVGSQGGLANNKQGRFRQTGFRVVKRRHGAAGISIVLEAVPSAAFNPSGIGTSAADNVKYRWHAEDGQPSGLWDHKVEIDVTPRSSSDPLAFQDRAGTGAFTDLTLQQRPIDPFHPEWQPHSWHWVVINYGYTGRSQDEKLGGAQTLPQVDVSLQVDMSPTQPPKGISLTGGAGRIAFRGQPAVGGGTPGAYGQLHGHDTTLGVGHGDPLMYVPLGYATSLHRADEPDHGTLDGAAAHGPFGDQYQSPPLGSHTGDNTPPGTYTAGWEPPDPKMGADKTTLLTYHYDWWVHFWTTPRLLGDFYHCGLDSTMKADPQHEVYESAMAWDDEAGTYVLLEPAAIDFEKATYAQTLTLEFRDPEDGTLVTSTPMEVAGVEVPIAVGDNGRLDFEFNPSSGWTVDIGAGGARRGDYGSDLTPGGDEEWRLDIVKRWTTYIRSEGCTCCKASDTNPDWAGTWDGAYMRKKAAEGDMANPWPNGCLHDSGQMGIYGLPPNNDTNDGQPCLVVFHSNLQGHTGNSSGMPGPDPLPAEGVCDDCHGCEGCDVDGPIFLGGEPEGNLNYVSVGGEPVLAPMNPDTAARAVFDNLVVLNNPWYRTDYIPDDTPRADGSTFEVEWYQDRFFTGKLSEEYVASELPGAENDGYGAVFRRGILELVGSRGRLGSITWTTYPSSNKALRLEPRVYALAGEVSGPGVPPRWNSDNADLLKSVDEGRGDRTWTRNSDFLRVDGVPVALTFDGEDAHYNGRRDEFTGQGPEVLIIGFQLGDMYVESGGVETTTIRDRRGFSDASGDFEVTNPTGIPTPIFESPVLEDVTINVIRESAQILYAEEGASE